MPKNKNKNGQVAKLETLPEVSSNHKLTMEAIDAAMLDGKAANLPSLISFFGLNSVTPIATLAKKKYGVTAQKYINEMFWKSTVSA